MDKKIIILTDGFNGHTVKCFAEPLEVDGNLVKLQVAEPGKEYMIKWARREELINARN